MSRLKHLNNFLNVSRLKIFEKPLKTSIYFSFLSGKVIESVVKAKDEGQESEDLDEDDLAMGDDRTSFLLSEFKPDLYQLAV